MEEIYKQNAFFGGLAKQDLDQLELPIDERHLEDGEIVFEESAKAQNLFFVASGAVRISKRGRGGKQETLTVKKPKDFFGEMALLHEDDQRRTARATAEGPTVLGVLNRDGLHAMLGHSPEFAIHFAQIIASQLKSANTRFIDELINAERLSLIGTMMSAMVHDFRNPIATLMVASQYMKSKTGDERMVRMGELATDATNQMQVMTQEVLDYSKGEIKLEFSPIDVTDLLDVIENQTLSTLLESGITIQREIKYNGEIIADRNRVIRLLNNIIKNAAEAMTGGGVLTLRIQERDGRIQIEIEDTGCGIPEDILARIFDPFVTYGKTNGTGLGMAIVKSVVEAHQGEITMESEVGKGTLCRIVLPLDAKPAN